MQPTETFEHIYHGYGQPGARCGVAIYRREDRRPVVVLTELPDNQNTSVTNLVEQIAAEIGRDYFPELLRNWTANDAPPIVFVEFYPADPVLHFDKLFGVDRYSVVTFSSYNVGRRFRGGRETVSLGTPTWKHTTADDLFDTYGIVPPGTAPRERACVESER